MVHLVVAFQKINDVLIDNAEDLDVVILCTIWLSTEKLFKDEYSENYSKTSRSLWNHYRDQPTNDSEINHLNSKSFDYKSSVIGKLGDTDNENKSNKENL